MEHAPLLSIHIAKNTTVRVRSILHASYNETAQRRQSLCVSIRYYVRCAASNSRCSSHLRACLELYSPAASYFSDANSKCRLARGSSPWLRGVSDSSLGTGLASCPIALTRFSLETVLPSGRRFIRTLPALGLPGGPGSRPPCSLCFVFLTYFGKVGNYMSAFQWLFALSSYFVDKG